MPKAKVDGNYYAPSETVDISEIVKQIINSSNNVKTKQDLESGSHDITNLLKLEDNKIILPLGLIESSGKILNDHNGGSHFDTLVIYQCDAQEIGAKPVMKPIIGPDNKYHHFIKDITGVPLPKESFEEYKKSIQQATYNKWHKPEFSSGITIDKAKASVTGIDVKLDAQPFVLTGGHADGGKSNELSSDEMDELAFKNPEWQYLDDLVKSISDIKEFHKKVNNSMAFFGKTDDDLKDIFTGKSRGIHAFGGMTMKEISYTLDQPLFHYCTFFKETENILLNLLLIREDRQPLLTIRFNYHTTHQLFGSEVETTNVLENVMVIPDLSNYEIDLRTGKCRLNYLAVLEPQGYIDFIHVRAFSEYENYCDSQEYKYSISGTQNYQTSVNISIENIGRPLMIYLDYPFKKNFAERLIHPDHVPNMDGCVKTMNTFKHSDASKLRRELSDIYKDSEVYGALYEASRHAGFIYKHDHIKQLQVMNLAGYFKDSANINNANKQTNFNVEAALNKVRAEQMLNSRGERAIKFGRL